MLSLVVTPLLVVTPPLVVTSSLGAGVVHPVVPHQIRQIGSKQHGPLTIHKPPNLLGIRRVAAQQSVLTQRDQLTGLRNRRTRLIQSAFNVELIIIPGLHLPIEHATDQIADLTFIEPGQLHVKIRKPLKLRQQPCELRFIPLADSLVERKVERLLLLNRQVNENNVDLLVPQILQNRQPLVPPDNGAGPPIDDNRLQIPKRLNAPLQIFIYRIPRPKLHARVVLRGVQLADPNPVSYTHLTLPTSDLV